jgi:hypothetical protein
MSWVDQVNGGTPEEQEAADAALEAELAFNRAVSTEAERIRVRDAAHKRVTQENTDTTTEPTPQRLDEFLAIEDDPAIYRIEGLWPVGGRVVNAAQYKAGKTTLVANVIRALADGEKFLGQFNVRQPAGTIVLFDNELDPRMMRRWLRDQGIINEDRVVVVSLRGAISTFNLLDEECRARWAKKLRDVFASVIILDCLRPVLDAIGLSEDKEAGRFLVAFDALLAEAGASEALVTHHMGHTGERSRGDTRIRDWPDVEWTLVREKPEEGEEPDANARRYFKAYGRDVDQPESLLTYEHENRSLSMSGGSRKDTAIDAVVPDITDYLKATPGASGRQIELYLAPAHSRELIRKALRRATLSGLIETEPGARNATLHYLVDPPEIASAPSAPEAVSALPSERALPFRGGRTETTVPTIEGPRTETRALKLVTTDCQSCGEPLAQDLIDDHTEYHILCQP